jgi:hypothetical protein
MTCVLRSDGWEAISSARFSAVLPQELTLVPGSLSHGAFYDPLARRVTWAGSLERTQELMLRFTVQVAQLLPDGISLSFPASIGYDDHAITYERPYVLRVNAPDLSTSTLSAQPGVSPPFGVLTYTLAVRNAGVRDATATVSATLPLRAVFTGMLDSGGIGSGKAISRTLTWSGPVAAGDQVTLRYRVALGNAGDYLLVHRAEVTDQFGEWWPLEARTAVRYRRLYFPQMHK